MRRSLSASCCFNRRISSWASYAARFNCSFTQTQHVQVSVFHKNLVHRATIFTKEKKKNKNKEEEIPQFLERERQ